MPMEECHTSDDIVFVNAKNKKKNESSFNESNTDFEEFSINYFIEICCVDVISLFTKMLNYINFYASLMSKNNFKVITKKKHIFGEIETKTMSLTHFCHHEL